MHGQISLLQQWLKKQPGLFPAKGPELWRISVNGVWYDTLSYAYVTARRGACDARGTDRIVGRGGCSCEARDVCQNCADFEADVGLPADRLKLHWTVLNSARFAYCVSLRCKIQHSFEHRLHLPLHGMFDGTILFIKVNLMDNIALLR